MTGVAAEVANARRAILVADFDSLAQARNLCERDEAEFIADYIAMARLARLVSTTVLVTDAMVLDGAFFLLLGPRRLGALLGAGVSVPIIVTGPHASLREGLSARIKQRKKFTWALAATHLWQDGSPSARVRRGWEEWLEAVDSGLVAYRRQRGVFELDPAWPRPECPSLPELADEVSRMTRRSDMLGLLASRGEKMAAAEKAALERWWTAAYLRGIGRQAGADWVSFNAPVITQSAQEAATVLHPPIRLMEWLRNASSATFAVAWDTTTEARRALQNAPSAGRFRNLAYAATEVAQVRSRRRVLAGSTVSIALAAILIGVAFPGVNTEAFDNPITWMAFAAAAVSTIPYSALGALGALLPVKSDTTLLIHASPKRTAI